MLVNVTLQDIGDGVRGSPCNCPVARAVAHATGAKALVGAVIWVRITAYHTPRSVREFVSRFDAGLTVEPFAFMLVPECS